MMRKIVMAALFAVGAWLPQAARAQSELISISLPAPSLASALQRALERTEIRLHNLGPLRNGSYHQPMASSVKFRPAEGPGRRTRFTLPEQGTVVLGRRYGYFVDNLRGDGIFVLPQPDRFTLTLTLKQSGPALVGRCVWVRSGAPCATLGEAQMPGIAWSGARVDIDMVPIRLGSSLAFEATTVSIGGTFDVAAACAYPVVGSQICRAIDRASVRVRAKVAEEVKRALNDAAIKREVAAAVREHLDKTAEISILGVRRVSMQDGVVTIGLGLGR